MTQSTNNELMTLPEMANYLGLAERTIYQWAQQGKVPAFKLGSSWRFRKLEVDGWLETQRTGPKPTPQSYLTDSIPPPRSNFRDKKEKQQEQQAQISDCKADVLKVLADETRDVWTIEQFEDVHSPEIAAAAIEQLRKTKKIAVSEEKGLQGQLVTVIRRA